MEPIDYLEPDMEMVSICIKHPEPNAFCPSCGHVTHVTEEGAICPHCKEELMEVVP